MFDFLFLPGAAQSTRLEFFPLFLLLILELARQRFNWNVVLLTEVSPEDEAQIKCSSLVRDYVVDGGWLFGRFFLVHVNPDADSI